jgi:CubicO group peptidase (beta-lactamase class C family)
VGRFSEVVRTAQDAMEELGVPGVAVGVLADGEEETAGLGVTSIENRLEVTPDTLFQIGSIAKTFTATLAMRLVEQGKLELDAPVRTYLPHFRLSDEAAADAATIRHLLTHTGGWVGDYFDDFGWGDDALARMVGRMGELPQLTPLGEVWSYNNSGFYVLGRVVEVVTGRTFEAATRELVLDPLGLEHAYFFMDDVITRRFVVGHELDESEATIVARPWAIGRAAHAAGGLVTSVHELLRYARFWIDGGDLLRPESVAEMLRPQVEIGGNIEAVGLAWMLMSIEDACLISHGGGTKGQISWLAIAPERRFALVVLTNHERGGVVADRVAQSAYEAYLGVREADPTPIDLPRERLEEYLGRYEARLSDVVLAEASGRLEARVEPKGGFPTPDTPPPPAPPPLPIAFASENEIFVPEGMFKGDRGVFLRDADGKIAWLRVGGRVYAPAGR